MTSKECAKAIWDECQKYGIEEDYAPLSFMEEKIAELLREAVEHLDDGDRRACRYVLTGELR